MELIAALFEKVIKLESPWHQGRLFPKSGKRVGTELSGKKKG